MKFVFEVFGVTSVLASIYMVAANIAKSDIQMVLAAVLVLGGLNLIKD